VSCVRRQLPCPVGEEGAYGRHVRTADRKLVVVEAVERAHHLGEHDSIEARVDLARTLQQCRSIEALREKSRASARLNSATSLRPASSSGANVGPAIEMTGGRPAAESMANSTISSLAPVT